MIFHIPHSSVDIPFKLRQKIILSPARLDQEILVMTDHYTDVLFTPFAGDDDTVIIFDHSRLVVDPERFPDDSLEMMSHIGMGVIYTKTFDGLDIREEPTEMERQQLLDTYYFPHHQKLENAVTMELETNQSCLIIDCHSFPSTPLPFEFNQSTPRPDFCLGIDDYHTPEELSSLLEQKLHELDYTVGINSPYCGCIIPQKFCKNDKRVLSVMIEINRSLYMGEETGNISEGFEEIKKSLGEVITLLRDTYKKTLHI
jgi:N-formylglutamate amidohydrolase